MAKASADVVVALLVAITTGSFVATMLLMPRFLYEEWRQVQKVYHLNLQLRLAIDELYKVFRTKTVHQVTLVNLREIIRTMDSIEGMTLEDLEEQAKRINRPMNEVIAANADGWVNKASPCICVRGGDLAGD